MVIQALPRGVRSPVEQKRRLGWEPAPVRPAGSVVVGGGDHSSQNQTGRNPPDEQEQALNRGGSRRANATRRTNKSRLPTEAGLAEQTQPAGRTRAGSQPRRVSPSKRNPPDEQDQALNRGGSRRANATRRTNKSRLPTEAGLAEQTQPAGRTRAALHRGGSRRANATRRTNMAGSQPRRVSPSTRNPPDEQEQALNRGGSRRANATRRTNKSRLNRGGSRRANATRRTNKAGSQPRRVPCTRQPAGQQGHALNRAGQADVRDAPGEQSRLPEAGLAGASASRRTNKGWLPVEGPVSVPGPGLNHAAYRLFARSFCSPRYGPSLKRLVGFAGTLPRLDKPHQPSRRWSIGVMQKPKDRDQPSTGQQPKPTREQQAAGVLWRNEAFWRVGLCREVR